MLYNIVKVRERQITVSLGSLSASRRRILSAADGTEYRQQNVKTAFAPEKR